MIQYDQISQKKIKELMNMQKNNIEIGIISNNHNFHTILVMVTTMNPLHEHINISEHYHRIFENG